MIKKQSKTKEMYDKHCRALPKLNIGDDVICVEDKKRCRAKVVGEADTPRSYIIQNKIGSRFRRNRRHLIKCDMGDHPSSSNSKQSCPSECSDNEFEDADSDTSKWGFVFSPSPLSASQPLLLIYLVARFLTPTGHAAKFDCTGLTNHMIIVKSQFSFARFYLEQKVVWLINPKSSQVFPARHAPGNVLLLSVLLRLVINKSKANER
ncbi:hypothetical protein K1T71_004942 [Dendrolimus kikuchii]|uniref:Uncharacterized protein n=1 Tax=Dendrolimus kikuchii TaxID=765133 RepID=A0ACC1D600_9NEOP|nr:hypothetical protein K1T71_004942 [Dendrolimus kikuchii]